MKIKQLLISLPKVERCTNIMMKEIRTVVVSVRFMVAVILFCVCLITANLLECKVIDVFGLSLTAGLLVFPISYILNDCIVEVWGYKLARLTIWLGFGVNLFVMLLMQMARILPSPEYWEHGAEFDFVFGFGLRIVLASMVAYLFGSFSNAFFMSRMKRKTKGRHFSVRAIASTVLGESLDSLFFFPIAFAGVMPMGKLLEMMLLQALIKSAYEMAALPVTVLVVKRLKKKENTDVIDGDLSYSPFRFTDI